MIYVCPNCGSTLPNPLQYGICICNNCRNFFDSSKQSKLLAASWIARKKNYSYEQMVDKLLLTNEEAFIVDQKINIDSLCHEDFLKYLNKIDVPNRCYK